MAKFDSSAGLRVPARTLFQCHHQDHMDEGFAGLITCV